LGSTHTLRARAPRLARPPRACVLLPEYRLAPEHPFPAAVLDVCTVYRALRRGLDADQLAIVGDAAGGGLALAALMALRDAGDELPAAAVCISPWLDLEATGASAQSGAVDDPLLRAEALRGWAQLYAGEQLLRDPLAAPLYGDCQALPPLLLQVGTREILLDDAVRFSERARRAGVQVTLERWQGLVHAWPLLGPELPEAEQALRSVARFLERHWVG
jgi:epsilon-lactone hydrolase